MKWTGYAVAAGLALGLALPAAAKDKLVINSFGGAYEQTLRRLVIEPFEKENDVEVQVVTAYSADALAQLRAQKASPQYDVVHFSGGQEIVAAKEGLIAPVKPEELSHAGELYPFAIEGLARGEGPVYQVAAIGLLYNTEATPKAPTRWADLWDPAFRAHIVLTDLSNSYGLLGFLMMNRVKGGDLSNIQPGLEAVKDLLPYATIVKTSPEIQQSFAQADAWIAPYAQDYAYTLRKAGLPVVFVQPEEGSPAVYITANLVAGRPHQDLAKKFIDFELDKTVQEGWAEALRYAPTNRTAVLQGDLAREVVNGADAIGRLVRFDPPAVDAARAGWVEQWNKLIAK